MAKIIRDGIVYGVDTVNLATNTTGTLPISKGGTGATTVADAKANLGVDFTFVYSSTEPSTGTAEKTVWIG